MEGYLFAKSGYERGDTFCCWVYSKLNEIATTGNLRPDIFGIYYRNGNELSLSRTFKREYDNDFEAAYNEIRRQIVWLLEDVSMDKYDVIEKVDLAKLFVYKILVVYFPDKFLPICVKKMMEEVCVAMDLPFSDKKKVILYDNIKLREMKEEHQSIRYWDNETFLGFCRYEHMVRAENCRKTAMSVLKNKDMLSIDELRKACKYLYEKYPTDFVKDSNAKRCVMCLDYRENYEK